MHSRNYNQTFHKIVNYATFDLLNNTRKAVKGPKQMDEIEMQKNQTAEFEKMDGAKLRGPVVKGCQRSRRVVAKQREIEKREIGDEKGGRRRRRRRKTGAHLFSYNRFNGQVDTS